MSFPSAMMFLGQGMPAEDALFEAFKKDTPLGFAYVRALASAAIEMPGDLLGFMKSALGDAGDVLLRAEYINGDAAKVDIVPDSPMGREVSRLLGTDVARNILEGRMEVSFGLANCCGGIGAKDPKKTKFTPDQQIAWQTLPDC